MFRNILVPLDGSDVAECVLPHVEALAAADSNIAIALLYVVEALDIPFTDQSFKKKIETEGRAAAKKYLNDVQNRLNFSGAIRCEVVIGKPAETIIDYSAERKIDVIIMATHGRSGVDRWIRGSVADKVIRTSPIPVWLVHACSEDNDMYDKWPKITLLLPLDGSDFAGSAIEQAEMLTRQLGIAKVEIVIIRVCELFTQPNQYPPHMSMSWEEYAKYETKRSIGICTDYVKDVEKKLKEQGFTVRSEVLTGAAAVQIADYASKNPVNLIIMSTHGRSGIGLWAFGSTTEKVLASVKRPVLLMRRR